MIYHLQTLCNIFILNILKRTGIALILFACIYNSSHSQIKINEILAANLTIKYDTKYNFESWVELSNSGSANFNIGGYYLSNDKNYPAKWKIPANTTILAQSYLLIWCNNATSGLNANFSLDPRGSVLYLSSPSLQIVDSITFPQQYPDVSYGRVNNSTVWSYLIQPTASAANFAEGAFGRLLPPVFSKLSGRYSSSISLTLAAPLINSAQIRYTIDGSEPTLNSPIYSGPISITKTTVVKAKVYHAGAIPSQTIANTYFINERAFTLPVVSVSMNPEYLNNNTIGIYVAGTNGITGKCSDTPVNWNQDWERASFAQFFSKEGKELLSQSFGASLFGNCSRTSPQKSLSFQARQKYEKGDIDLKIYRSKEINNFDAFNLRNGGNDFWNAMIRDGLMQTLLIDKMDVDYQAFEPAMVYINGAYWGVMNIREKLDDNYIKNNYKVSKDSIDMLEGEKWSIVGSNTEYNNFLNKIKTIDFSKKESFGFIDSNIDVNEYIHYMVAEIYYANTDWPGNNIKYWKHKRPGSKWRWIMFDTDFGFALYSNNSTATHQTLHFVTDSITTESWPNPQWSTLLFRKFIKNPVFKERFIQSFNSAISSVFVPSRVHHFIDSISAIIATEMVYHKQKWGGSFSDWNNDIQKLHNFADQRYTFFIPYFNEFFKLGKNAKVTVKPESLKMGKTFVNAVNVNSKDTLVLSQGLGINVNAIPLPGYVFKQWKIKSTKVSRDMLIRKGDPWKYDDSGTDPGISWTNGTYNDESWSEGPSELGYGDGDEETTLSYGTDANNKYVTTYFRKSFSVSDRDKISGVKYNILYDDGCVIYINGTEITRYNMPSGMINYNTFANSASTEGVFVYGTFDPSVLLEGDNVIAVEIHQNSITSSDISFNFELESTQSFGDTSYFSDLQVLQDTVNSDMDFIAEFEPKIAIDSIFINEISAKDSRITDEYNETGDWFELFNGNSDTIDISGLYITDYLKNPCKYKISRYNLSNVKIPPKGFYVFWADNDEFQGINHCPFKLYGDGEQLGIYQIIGEDTICLDSITYGKQSKGLSYIRFPDGSDNFIFTNSLTPKATNKESVTIPLYISGAETFKCTLFPNPAKTYFVIKFNDQFIKASYEIISLQGVIQEKRNLLSDDNIINCEKIKPGMYVLKIYNNNKVWLSKIVIER